LCGAVDAFLNEIARISTGGKTFCGNRQTGVSGREETAWGVLCVPGKVCGRKIPSSDVAQTETTW
jgi:hypothetical protein